MTAPGKIMESALLAGEVAWGLSKLDLAGQFFCGLLRVFPFPGSKLFDAEYSACLPHQYGKLCTWQYSVLMTLGSGLQNCSMNKGSNDSM